MFHGFNEQASRPWRCEAAEYAIANGLSGIAGVYNFPNGMTPQQFVSSKMFVYAMTHPDIRHLDKLWFYLRILNPGILSEVPVDVTSREQLQHAIIGVASLYNSDDLACHARLLQRGGGLSVFGAYLRAPETEKICAEIAALKPQGDIDWLPAPQTLTRIRDQLAAKNSSQPKPPAP